MSTTDPEGRGRASSTALVFSAHVYPLDALKKAAYAFSRHAIVDIAGTEEVFTCTLHFPQPLQASEVAELENAFRLEVLDQDLRVSIARETAPARNLILAVAFSRTGIQSE